jgi:MFS family permease
MALSVYLLATALGPLVVGPLSEIYGRKSIFHFTNVWFLVGNIICGFANLKGLLIAAGLLAGVGASAAYSLAYGVLGDVWSAEQRGPSLSLYLIIPLTGSAIGPIVSGFIVQYLLGNGGSGRPPFSMSSLRRPRFSCSTRATRLFSSVGEPRNCGESLFCPCLR